MRLKKYRVTLNFNKELHKFEIKAKTPDIAKYIGIKKLCEKLKLNFKYYKIRFNGAKDNLKIMEMD